MKIYSNESTLNVIDKSVSANMPVLLVGETGTGKTTIIREVAKKNKKELIRVNLNGQTGIEELVGKWLIEKGKTVWNDGIMIKAMKEGQWIVFDEINAALPEVLFTLNSLLDDDRKVVMIEKQGEVIRPKESFRFFATMNPSDEYTGTKEMNKALLSRFGAVLNVEPLEEDQERDILINEFKAKDEYARILARISILLRDAKKKEEIFFFCSTRDLINTTTLMNMGIDLDVAILNGIVNKANADERKLIVDIITRVYELEEIKTESEKVIEKAKKESKKAIEEAKKEIDENIRKMNKVQERAKDIEKQAMDITKKTNEYIERTTTELSDKSTEMAKEIAKEIFEPKESEKPDEGESGETEESEKEEGGAEEKETGGEEEGGAKVDCSHDVKPTDGDGTDKRAKILSKKELKKMKI